MQLICYAFKSIKHITWGSYIRMYELTKSLGFPLVHGSGVTRFLKVIENAPPLFRTDNILIFDYMPLPYDLFLFDNLLKKHNFILDVADIPHLQSAYFGYRPSAQVQKLFLRLVSMSSTLLFVSPSLVNLLDINLKDKKIVLVPNASNPFFFRETPIPKSKKKVILYTGGYARMRGLDLLVGAFDILRRKRKDIILKIVAANFPHTLQRDSVIVERKKFYSDMPNIYSESSLCVIPHRKNPYMDAALPIKLFDAMAAARPVIATNCYETEKIVEREKCGLITEEANAESLAEAIDYALSNDSLSQEMGKKGREAVERRHSWHQRAQTIIRNI